MIVLVYNSVCVYVWLCMAAVDCTELMPEGGRDRLAPLFYHPVFADDERRASLGTLAMDEATADHGRRSQGQSTYSPASFQLSSQMKS